MNTTNIFAALMIFVSSTAAAVAAAEPVPTPVKHPYICSDNGQGKVFVVSAAGKIEWEYAVNVPQDVWALPNGNYLFSHLRGVMEVAPDKKIVWEYKSPDGTEIHTCQPLPGGLVMTAECGTKRILEIDRQGKVTKEIPFETTTGGVHGQIRIARKLTNGHYLLALTGEHAVNELDDKGQIVRRIKVPGDPYVGVRLPNGNTLIACGDGHKIIEVDAADKVVWQIEENELPGIPLRFVAGLQRLPNGNTVVCNWGGHGHVGQQALVFEVTPKKNVVWKVEDYNSFRTIAHIQLLDVKGNPVKGELLR